MKHPEYIDRSSRTMQYLNDGEVLAVSRYHAKNILRPPVWGGNIRAQLKLSIDGLMRCLIALEEIEEKNLDQTRETAP